jgi:L-lactate dehydrogenase
MSNDYTHSRKVVIVGAGDVGSSFAYALAQSGAAEEIAIVDLNKDLMRGQVLDLIHGAPYYPTVKINEGDKNDYADARVIVITAGAKQKPGESRLELLKKNVKIIEGYLISDHCNVDVKNVHAYIIGEHGDSELAAWSMCHIGGVPLDEFLLTKSTSELIEKDKKIIEQSVKDSAYHIIDYKGATYYAVGMALVRITLTILRNERSILSVSICLDGEYGLNDVCLGVPCVVSAQGVEEIIEKKLPENEQKSLEQSAEVLKESILQVGK